MRRRSFFIVSILAVLAVAAVAYADYKWAPQYKNQGEIGTADKPWGRSYVQRPVVTGSLHKPFDPGVLKVTSYTQMTTNESGMSIFVINPATMPYHTYEFDLTKIYNSCTPSTGVTPFRDVGLATGLTVAVFPPTSLTDGYEFAVRKAAEDTGSTPIQVWQPTANGQVTGTWSGVTPAGTLITKETSGDVVSGASSQIVNQQYEHATYRLEYESSVSLFQVSGLTND